MSFRFIAYHYLANRCGKKCGTQPRSYNSSCTILRKNLDSKSYITVKSM